MMFYYFCYLLRPIVKQSVLLNKNQRKLEKKTEVPFNFIVFSQEDRNGKTIYAIKYSVFFLAEDFFALENNKNSI